MRQTLPLPFRRFPPLWWLAPPPFPLFRGHYGCWAFRAICAWSSSGEKPNNRASSVGRFIGRSFCVQAKDKLRPTWRPSAGSPQQKCTPFGAGAPLLLKGSMSLDSQVVLLPYESSSFATPEGEVLAAIRFAVLMRALLPCGLLCPCTAGERWCRRHQRGKSHRRRLLPADWYLLPVVSNAACTEILRWRSE